MAAKKKRVAQAERKDERGIGERVSQHTRLLVTAMLLLLFAIGGAVGAHWLQDPETLPMRHVQVQGEFRFVDEQELTQRVSEHLYGGFFSVDVDAVRAAAQELAWVDHVSVRRIWPDTLRLIVREQQPAARWGETGLLNTRGELFHPPAATVPAGLPLLAGPDELRERVMQQYLKARELLALIDRQPRHLELDARRAWHLELDNGVQVDLGREDAEPRLLRFVRAYPALARGQVAIERVDMRYSNGFSVLWQGQSEIADLQREEG